MPINERAETGILSPEIILTALSILTTFCEDEF